ncbi:baseplate assembly protein [Yersinia phage vB_YenM_P778]
MAVARRSNVLARQEDEMKKSLYTTLPAKILAYDASTQTCTAQPLMQSNDLAMPAINNVPVIFPAGGGAVLSFPVKAGDRCILSFMMYPISDWVRSDGKANININQSRTHHISECVAHVGLCTMKTNYQPDTTRVMLRFGKTKLTLDDDGNVEITGKLTVSEEITGKDFISSTTGVTFNNHTHHYYWTDPSGDADTETAQ